MGQCVASLNAHRSSKVVTPTENRTRRNEWQSLIEPSQKQFIEHPLENDYIILSKVLGKGMSGMIRVAERIEDGKKCALKVLPDTEASRREIDLQIKCSQHRNIVRIIDVYLSQSLLPKRLFVVLEYMEGGALFKRIINESITEREAARIMHEIGSAVAYLHSLEIAHRDIKPENILCTNDGTVKLADFGFAKQCSSENRKTLKTPCFTPYYVPPEILRRVPYDKSCDMWSLGVVMYMLLCGLAPFYPHSDSNFSNGMQKRIKKGVYKFPSPEWDQISEQAKSLVRRLLVVDSQKRLTAEQFMKDRWILEHTKVATAPLHTGDNLSIQKIDLIQEMMKIELTRMRTNTDFQLKPLHASNNRILQRRREQQKQNDLQCVQLGNAQNEIQHGNNNSSTYDNVY